MSLIILLCYQLWIIKVLSGELRYPKAIKVSDGDTLRMKSVYIKNKIFDPDDKSKTMIDMTGRALCINDICSIPAPTLIVYPGITFHIELENLFHVKIVDETDSAGPDVVNIHSHGLHISGSEDNAFEAIFPRQKKMITWTIHPQHHIGTNWYHTHVHKSTAIQVMGGMYGALIVDSGANKRLNYNTPFKINDYVLHISWQFLHDNEYCENCVNYGENAGKFKYSDSFKCIDSLCGFWCNGYSETQREKSGFEYDVKLADGVENNQDKIDEDDFAGFEGFLVNNQYQPTISKLGTNEYFKLRIISSSAEIYTQLQFDYNFETNCKYYMIARDGIALMDVSRDLSKEPYYGFFMLPPGGRIDIKILCTGEGIANIRHNELHPYYARINESYPMGRIDEQILFKLSVRRCTRKHNTIMKAPHLDYPEPVTGFPYYLKELLEDSNDNKIDEYSQCQCSNYDRENAQDEIVKNTTYCALELMMGSLVSSLDELFEVNGVTFDPVEAIFIISLNTVYEFYINSDGHPFHIHVNPFMVKQDLLNGYIAKKNDWMDTLGYKDIDPDGDNGFKIKYNTRDFTGNVILHCHFLGHEDLGMMAFIKIVDAKTDNFTQCNIDYGFQNDYLQGAAAHTNNNNNNNNNVLTLIIIFQYKYEILIFLGLFIVSMVINVFICCIDGNKRNKKRIYSKIVFDEDIHVEDIADEENNPFIIQQRG